MNELEHSEALREHETTASRTADARMSIDPGLVHHRLIQNVVRKSGVEAINAALAQIPPDTHPHLRALQTDHVYVDALITLCSHLEIPSLSRMLSEGKGRMFASVETLAPCPEVYTAERVTSVILPKFDTDLSVQLEYATERIASDTTRMELAEGREVAIVAQIRHFSQQDKVLILEPLVVGGPSLEPAHPETVPDAMWLGYSFGEVFAEDIDEFSAIRDVPMPDDISVMGKISELALKTCLAEILGTKGREGLGWRTIGSVFGSSPPERPAHYWRVSPQRASQLPTNDA